MILYARLRCWITRKYSNVLFWELSLFLGLYANLDKMLIFRLGFVLLFMKLSGKNGIWSHAWKTDKHLYIANIKYQKNYRKLKKAELDLKFLYWCKGNEVYLKFMQWKHCKGLKPEVREKYHNTILRESISDTHKKIRSSHKILK